jgi:hypothetical protein
MSFLSPKPSQIILLLSVITQITLTNPAYPLKNETTMMTEEKFIKGAAFHIGDLLVGSGNDEVTDKTTMNLEIQEGGFVIGENTMSGWGITCAKSQDETKNSCFYDPNATPVDDIYRKNPFKLIDGYAYLRVDDSVKIDPSKFC